MFILALKEIPNLYSNFVEEQYMSIFAICNFEYLENEKSFLDELKNIFHSF